MLENRKNDVLKVPNAQMLILVSCFASFRGSNFLIFFTACSVLTFLVSSSALLTLKWGFTKVD